MSQALLERRGSVSAETPAIRWARYKDNTYELRVVLVPDVDGFTASVVRLPGVRSEGDTEQDALDNIRDAFQAVAAEYLKESGSIPWSDSDIDYPAGTVERWILVDV